MSAALPPGWTEVRPGEQTLTVGPFLLTAYGGGSWDACLPEAGESCFLSGRKWPDGMPEARRAALTALQTLLTTAVAEVGAALANLNDTEP